MQEAISQAATSCGAPMRRATTRLSAEHPAQCELDLALSERSLEHDPYTRFLLDRLVKRCRDRVRRTTAIARAEFVLNNPRIPRFTKDSTNKSGAWRHGGRGHGRLSCRGKGKLLTDFYASLFKVTEK